MMGHHGNDCTRRSFLKAASASAFGIALHEQLAACAEQRSTASEPSPEGRHRLLELHLVTAHPLDELAAYYRTVLELPIRKLDAEELIVGGGRTVIRFARIQESPSNPFYHVAFNIPHNKILTARTWLRERTTIDPAPVAPTHHDPSMPDDVVHFAHWNAHSLFFWDPAGNLLELIARHDLQNDADGPFTPDDILYASEIVFVVEDVPESATSLKRELSLGQYRGGSDRFHAIGDEHGLLLVMKRGVSLGGKANVFPTRAVIRGAERIDHSVTGYPYNIEMRA